MSVTIGHLLVHDLTIQRAGRTSDGEGGFLETDATVETIKGRIMPVSQKDLMLAGQLRAEVTHACYFDPDQSIQIDDVILFDGRSFVVRVSNITPSVPIYRKVMCLEVQSEA